MAKFHETAIAIRKFPSPLDLEEELAPELHIQPPEVHFQPPAVYFQPSELPQGHIISVERSHHFCGN